MSGFFLWNDECQLNVKHIGDNANPESIEDDGERVWCVGFHRERRMAIAKECQKDTRKHLKLGS